MNDSYSHRAKVWYASIAVWNSLVSGRRDPAKVATLLALLESDSDGYSRYVVLGTLRRQWDSTAENPVGKLLEAPTTPDGTKVYCAEVLMTHLPEKYANKVLDLMEQPNTSMSLLMDQRDDEPTRAGAGYFTACALERVVGATFKPDTREPKYQTKGNLSEAFFSDTVEAAIAWWAENEGLTPCRAPLDSNPELEQAYRAWDQSRRQFLESLGVREPEAVERAWEKDYFQGHTPDNQRFPENQTRLHLKEFVDSDGPSDPQIERAGR